MDWFVGFGSGVSGASGVSGGGLSSKRMRNGGENPSSNCRCLTLQMKAPRKSKATDKLATRSRMMTLISDY